MKVKWIYPGRLHWFLSPVALVSINKPPSFPLGWIKLAFLSGFWAFRFLVTNSQLNTVILSVTCRMCRHFLVHVLDFGVLREPRWSPHHHRWGALLHRREYWGECQAHGSFRGEEMVIEFQEQEDSNFCLDSTTSTATSLMCSMWISLRIPSLCFRNSKPHGKSSSPQCLSMQSSWQTSAGVGPSTCCWSANLHTLRRCLALR